MLKRKWCDMPTNAPQPDKPPPPPPDEDPSKGT